MRHYNVNARSIIIGILEEGRLTIDTSVRPFAVTVDHAGSAAFSASAGTAPHKKKQTVLTLKNESGEKS